METPCKQIDNLAVFKRNMLVLFREKYYPKYKMEVSFDSIFGEIYYCATCDDVFFKSDVGNMRCPRCEHLFRGGF